MKTRGFTLIELLIVVAIVGIVSVMSFVKISYRLKVSKLEEAAQSLVSDVDYARSAAMMKGCPIRFVFCQDRNCSELSEGTVSVGGASAIGKSGEPSRYYALLRMSQGDDDEMCYSPDAVMSDGFNSWDFDRRPQSIPQGVVFSPVYTSTGDIPNYNNWIDTTSSDATNSLWFDDEGELTAPIVDTANVVGATADYRIVFQVRLDDCDPTASGTDDGCLGFLIATPETAGQARMIRCVGGSARTAGALDSNNCF